MKVAPRAGAWIETVLTNFNTTEEQKSPLAQGRGLKHHRHKKDRKPVRSPLAQGRGLKHISPL